MDRKNKHERLAVQINAAKIFFAVATFLMLTFLVIGEILSPDESDKIHTNWQEFKGPWYQIQENGEKKEVEVPGTLEAEYGEVVTLVTRLPKDVVNGDNICFRPIWQDVDIYINGELRRSYNTKKSRPFGKNSAFRYLFVELTEEDAGAELVYQFSSDSKYTGNMRPCYIGDKVSLWMRMVGQSGTRTIVTLFLLIMSICCILVCVILKWVYKKHLTLNYLAWTVFLCALWMLSELEFRQLFFQNISILTSCTYWSLMLIPIPLMLYIDEIQDGRYRKVYIIPIFYMSCVIVIGTILQVFDIVQFVEQLKFVHAGLLVAIVSIIITITIDAIKKQLSDYVSVAIGIYGMLVAAVLEMVVYYMDTGVSIGTVLAIGMIFLLIMAIIKTGNDLLRTEQKRQQAVLAREAQAKFLANMSHEIRTPINAIIGMNEMVLRENKSEAIHGYACDIKSASNMLLGLVNDILDFSKIESGQLELVEENYSLAHLIQDEILLLNARAIGKPISTEIDIDPKIPSGLFGDELRIKQILTNILSNAVKYTKEGTVTLKASFEWIEEENVKLCFSISDTGIGIKEEDITRLFDSFKRLDLSKNRNIEGTGLGLNIAKQLVDLMQGEITVESEYGKGSTFIISIPQRVIDKNPIGKLEDLVKKRRKAVQQKEDYFIAPEARILIVDDNAMNLSVMKGLLKRTQVQTDLASSGEECLELAKRTVYDIILMDHMMPEMDGVEALKRLRADVFGLNQNTTVIALTANAVAGCREKYLEYGFNDYIAKPVEAEKLDETLIKYIPEELICHQGLLEKEVAAVKQEMEYSKEESDLLYIDKELGLSYSSGLEEIYNEICELFIQQVEEYLPQLEDCFQKEVWEQYAVIAHALKGNSLNIGASNFSKLSLQHELAGKEGNKEFIQSEYEDYIRILKGLLEKVKEMID